MVAIDDGSATIIAAAFVFAASIFATLYTQGRRNRAKEAAEHNINTGKLDHIIENQQVIRHEVDFMRADIADIRGSIKELRQDGREVEGRVVYLERHRPPDDVA
jgi:HAMP domain-containing protein